MKAYLIEVETERGTVFRHQRGRRFVVVARGVKEAEEVLYDYLKGAMSGSYFVTYINKFPFPFAMPIKMKRMSKYPRIVRGKNRR